MNALVKPLVQIADKQTAVIEYNSMPVMLTEQLADFYGTDPVRIQQNCARNSERFIEGKHFFRIEGDDLRELKCSLTISKLVSPNTRSLILWTEKGASRHAKILDTDQAWNVFEQLEDCYFATKSQAGFELAIPQNLPSALRAYADQVEQNLIIAKERDHAIATKAEIGERREATAMATASKFKRECESLRQKLGESTTFVAVATINSKLKTNFGNKEGRQLSKYSREHGLEIKKATVQDQRFSEVNSYHRDAWLALFNINLNSVFGV
ncbi:ORF6N domain-containing protein [Acinetobacter sp. ULE_I001]|uniref:ORF6N domain-containing protein n=1 Tax=unclassified Acinetobacter TaxID=196816 RepID=UPI003AF68F20